MNDYNQKVCRYNGTWISYDELLTKVYEFLSDNPFQSHDYIAMKLGSKASMVESAIKDGVIKIAKKYKEENNTDIAFTYLCKTYGVKIKYIEDLIDEGRIVINDDFSDFDLEEIKQKEQEAKRTERLDNLRQLSESFNQTSSNRHGEAIPRFHIDVTEKRRK